MNGWAFPDEPPLCPRGQDAQKRWCLAIRYLAEVRKLCPANSRRAYYAVCVAESVLRNRVLEERAANPSMHELQQSELHSPGASFAAAQDGSGSSTGTRWTSGSTLSRP